MNKPSVINAPSDDPDSKRGRLVLFIPLWYPSAYTEGISGVFCQEHAIAARRAGVDLHVLNLVTDPTNRRGTFTIRERDDAAVPTMDVVSGLWPIPKTGRFVLARNLRRAVATWIARFGKPDVLYSQDARAIQVAKLAQRWEIPLVVSQHWTGFFRREITPLQRRQFQLVFQTAKYILPAYFQAEQDYSFYGLQGNVRWLPNVFDDTLFYPDDTPRECALLHASGFNPQKRFPDIVAAFRRTLDEVPEAVLHVAGEGLARKEMETLCHTQLPEGSFQFHGFVLKPELADLMRRVKGFVFPSDAETFGCVLMESMACGTPALTTQVGGIPAVAHDGEALFVNVGDVQQISEAMVDLLLDRHSIDGAEIATKMRHRFSYQAVGSLLREIFDDACPS